METKNVLITGLFMVPIAISCQNKMQIQQKPNVLFIAIDDLRPTLGCYGDRQAISPNIDRVASQGIVFTRAYCQEALCNPSRASILTGLRPDQVGVTNLVSHFRKKLPHVVTLPQLFKRNGYESIGIGKIFHEYYCTQDSISFSKPPTHNITYKIQQYYLPEHRSVEKTVSYECVDVPDDTYEDGKVTNEAIQQLHEFKASRKPFFLAVGFRKPHLPFCAPEKYWLMYYDMMFDSIPNQDRPINAPDIAYHQNDELRGYKDIPKQGLFDPGKAKALWHGYYACVSYIDAQVGNIMKTLKDLGLAENTIIVLWGDNGYHLGEQDIWCKATNFELDTRIPLIFSIPGMTKSAIRSNSIVEGVDIYPTLADLCELKPEGELAGVSLKPILLNPEEKLKNVAYSQVLRPYSALFAKSSSHMGYSIRTDEWRCTSWYNLQNDSLEFRELYNLKKTGIEKLNCSGEPKFNAVESKLVRLLRDYKEKKYSGVTNKIFSLTDSVYRVN